MRQQIAALEKQQDHLSAARLSFTSRTATILFS